jgi:hypothetical protein
MSVEYSTCTFTGTSEATKYIQGLLVARGATNLKVDGKWGPCTESAYFKIFGEPLGPESLQKNLDIICKKVTKVTPTTTCGDGSDGVSFSSQINQNLLRIMSPIAPKKEAITASRSISFKNIFATQPSGGGGGGTSTLAKSTMVAGVPDWALGVGLVAAVAGIAYLIKRK